MKSKSDETLDCLGLFCPEPVFRTRMKLDEMEVGETLQVIADDPAAKADLESLAENLGYQVLEIIQEGDVTKITIKKVK